jgi:hypothetical protein
MPPRPDLTAEKSRTEMLSGAGRRVPIIPFIDR